MVNLTPSAGDPLPIEHVEGFRRASPNDVADRFGPSIRRSKDAFVEEPENAAGDDGACNHRHRDAVQADAACLHHHELAVFREKADGDERRQQHRQRQDVIDVLRRREPEIRPQHVPRRLAAKHLVRQVQECRNVEDAGQRCGCERRHASIQGSDVAIENTNHRQPERGNRDRAYKGKCRETQWAIEPAITPEKQQPSHDAEHDVWRPRAKPRRDDVPAHDGLTKPEQDVVNENHRETDHEARELAVAPVAGAEREADETEYEAGEWNRKLLLDFKELGVWINPLLLELCGARLELWNRHFTSAERWPGAREHRFRVQAEHEPVEAEDLIFTGVFRLVARAVFQHHLNRPLLSIDDHASSSGQERRGGLRRTIVDHEHIGPAAARR